MSTDVYPLQTQVPGWSFPTALQLGRVSNLPTVWTNTLAAVVLSGSTAVTTWQVFLLIIAMSLAYTGGMFLNDAFDQLIDARERPERPIPSGKVAGNDVFMVGFTMLAGSIALVSIVAFNLIAFFSACALSITIIVYNAWHKGNALSPLLMALCRLLLYVTCSFAICGDIPSALMIGALITFSHLIGLTYTAKQEQTGHIKNAWPLMCLAIPTLYGIGFAGNSLLSWVCIAATTLWGLHSLSYIFWRQPKNISNAVVRLIAGISLIDALLIAGYAASNATAAINTWLLCGCCAIAFILTLVFQRFISGT